MNKLFLYRWIGCEIIINFKLYKAVFNLFFYKNSIKIFFLIIFFFTMIDRAKESFIDLE